MNRRHPIPTQEDLLSALTYNPVSGELCWNASGRGHKAGHAGTPHPSGPMVQFRHKHYFASRLIWKMVHNEEPWEIDHKDLNKHNNALDNLRAATSTQNKHNRRANVNNKLGVKGVCSYRGKYRVFIQAYGKPKHVGDFLTLEDAKAAYAKEVAELHGAFGRTV